jgi:hypothetical protein
MDIPLYPCERCEKVISHPQGNDDTGYLCEGCFDDLCGMADVYHDRMKDEALLAEFA